MADNVALATVRCHDHGSVCYSYTTKVQGECIRCGIYQDQLAKRAYACPECWPVYCFAQGYPPCPGTKCQKLMQEAREARNVLDHLLVSEALGISNLESMGQMGISQAGLSTSLGTQSTTDAGANHAAQERNGFTVLMLASFGGHVDVGELW